MLSKYNRANVLGKS